MVKIPSRVGIEHLLGKIDDQRIIGHLEGEIVILGHKQSSLATQIERRSGYLLAIGLTKGSAELKQAAMIRLLKPRRRAVQVNTLDNGSEFAGHEVVAMAATAAMFSAIPTALDSVVPTRAGMA